MLVWWPDNDTDNFFIITFPPSSNRIMRDMRRRIFAKHCRLYCLTYNMFQTHQTQTRINRFVQKQFCFLMTVYFVNLDLYEQCRGLENCFRLVIRWGQTYIPTPDLFRRFAYIKKLFDLVSSRIFFVADSNLQIQLHAYSKAPKLMRPWI